MDIPTRHYLRWGTFMKAPISFVCVFFLALSGCVPSVQLGSAWSLAGRVGRSLAIILPDENFEVAYSGSVKDEFGKGDMNALIRKNVREILVRRIKQKTCFKDVWVDKFGSEIPTTASRMSDGIEIGVPRQGTDVALAQSQADYILCLANVRISTSIMLNMTGMVPTSYSKELYMTTRFYLWDTRQKCVAESGYTSNKDDNGFYTDINNWIYIADVTINEIFEKTSFLLTKNMEHGNGREPGEELLEKP